MAKLVITSTPSNIEVQLNDYAVSYSAKAVSIPKTQIQYVSQSPSDTFCTFVSAFFNTEIFVYIATADYLIVDSIDGVAPTSNQDLYNKLKVAIGNESSFSSPTFETVDIASAIIVPANPKRKSLILINTSPNTISFGVDAPAELNSGITLYPNGVWIMDEETFTNKDVHAIASSAGSNLTIQELT